MVSSRESSPINAFGASSPAPLTPNSKIKALLASLDNDSEDESVSASPRRRLITSLAKPGSPASKGSKKTAEVSEKANDVSPTRDSDSEEEDIVRPKGRMAARMLAKNVSIQEDAELEEDNARESVKEMHVSKSKSPSPGGSDQDSNLSNESDGPILSRKRKIRMPRRPSPTSSPEKGPASPGLFVSPRKRKSASPPGNASNSDELPDAQNLTSNARFLALVERKKQERIARDAEISKEEAKKAAEWNKHMELLDQDDDLDDSDDNVERRLTQQARPTRKASKRALEEMHRETQRLSRNQQLAHKALTRKKVTKADFFARFNYKQDQKQHTKSALSSSSPVAQNSDTESRETPPTSPVSPRGDAQKLLPGADPVSAGVVEHTQVHPSLEDAQTSMQSSMPRKLDKGKGKTIENAVAVNDMQKKLLLTQRLIRVRPPKVAGSAASNLDDSDSDLEIVKEVPALKSDFDSIFDRVPAKQVKESHSLNALRMLAHIGSPGKQNVGRNKKPSITTTEMQVSLQQRARQQAAREREERLQALKAKGVILQTTEEREREMAEVDDLLAKARREGEEIMKREKAAAKKNERKAKGEADPLGESSDDDEDWEESKAIPEEDLSGSEEEDEEEGEESPESDASGEEEEEDGEDEMELDEQDAEKGSTNPIFDEEASETGDEEGDVPTDHEMVERADLNEEEEETLATTHRRPRNLNVISDDDETDDDVVTQHTPSAPHTASPTHLSMVSPNGPHSVLRSATKTFIPGLTVAGPAGLGLTQIFAGTMDDSQNDAFDASPMPSVVEYHHTSGCLDGVAFLRQKPAQELPPFVPTLEGDTQDSDTIKESQISHIPDTQPTQSMTQGIQLNFTQSQVHGFDSLVEATQMSPFPDPTPDVGFQNITPFKIRFAEIPQSTVDTLVLEPTAVPETLDETPVAKKKGKLRRRAPIVNFSDDEDVEMTKLDVNEEDLVISSNAFDVMRKSSKKKAELEDFDKKKSKAKEMVHEQAEESEDEYAGLGGASDDDSGGEDDAYVREMIDDEGGKDVNERELAAFFADRERANDEKQVEKLYNDITKGMLRRKRGAEYDLSDSDDGGEARQRRKRKEFAKMRKALLADERIGKIAENPKRQAFLRAIEDRGSDDEMDFLDDFVDKEEGTDSQSQSQGEGIPDVIPNSQLAEMGPPKRKRFDDASNIEARVPPHLRRTRTGKRPSNLSEIRESLSSLIEEPNAVIAPVDSESEDELEIEGEDLSSGPTKNKENRDPFALRRTNVAVIDRISLKRESSSTMSNSTRLAFSTMSSTAGFKIPALLKRATTNSSVVSSTSSGGLSATERMAGGAASEGVKRGGGKNSGVNYFARESERRAAVVKTEKRREQKLVKGAQVRRKVVGGMLGGGKFE